MGIIHSFLEEVLEEGEGDLEFLNLTTGQYVFILSLFSLIK